MGLPEFAKNMRVPVSYRDHVIDSGVLAWVFYERHNQGRLKPVVSVSRRKEARKKPGKTLDITRCMARDGSAGSTRTDGTLSVQNVVSLIAGVVALVMMRPRGRARTSTVPQS
jgi:hypothetical protein